MTASLRSLTVASAAGLVLGTTGFVATVAGQRGATPAPPAPAGEQALVTRARAIHERVITLDTHNDISPNDFQWSRNYTQDLGNQVNL